MKRISYQHFIKLKNDKSNTIKSMLAWMFFKVYDCQDYFLFKTTLFAKMLLWITLLFHSVCNSIVGFFSLLKFNYKESKSIIGDVKEWKVENEKE